MSTRYAVLVPFDMLCEARVEVHSLGCTSVPALFVQKRPFPLSWDLCQESVDGVGLCPFLHHLFGVTDLCVCVPVTCPLC